MYMSLTTPDITARLMLPISELLSLPTNTVVTNSFVDDAEQDEAATCPSTPPQASLHTVNCADATASANPSHVMTPPASSSSSSPPPMTVMMRNYMADAAERLITEITYALSVGLVERHELWTVLETLDLIPEKIQTETSLQREQELGHTQAHRTTSRRSTSSAGARSRTPPAPSITLTRPEFARRVQFAAQLVFVVKHTFKDFPAPVRTRAWLRLALNQGCLLAALELIARYNRDEIAVYYNEPWRSVLLQYDRRDVRTPGLVPNPNMTHTRTSASSVVSASFSSSSPQRGVSSRGGGLARGSTAHHTPLRSTRQITTATMAAAAGTTAATASLSPSPRRPHHTGVATATAATMATSSSSSELWGRFVAALSPVGGTPLCALESGAMTKGFSVIPFQLDLLVHGLDDVLPASYGRAPLSAAPQHHEPPSTCFLQQLGEYIYDLSPTAPSAYDAYRAVRQRERATTTTATQMAAVEETLPITAAASSPTGSASRGATTPTVLVQALPAVPSRKAAAAHSTHRRSKVKRAATATRLSETSPRITTTASTTTTTTPALSTTSSSREDGEGDAVGVSARRTQRVRELMYATTEAMQRYVTAATEADALQASTRPLVEKLRLMRQLSTLAAPATASAVDKDTQAEEVEQASKASTLAGSPSPQATTTTREVRSGLTETTARCHWQMPRSERTSFELQPDGSVVRCPPTSTSASSLLHTTTPSPYRTPTTTTTTTLATKEDEKGSISGLEVLRALEAVEKAIWQYYCAVEHRSERCETIVMGGRDVDAQM